MLSHQSNTNLPSLKITRKTSTALSSPPFPLLLPIAPSCRCSEHLLLKKGLHVACAFCCLLSDVLFPTSLSPTTTNGSFLLLSTYSSLTKLLGSSYRKELSSIVTFSYNCLTLQSSKSNPFSS